MVHSLWRSLTVPLWISFGAVVSAYDECLLGFGLQGLNPFESTDWVGLPICGENLAAAEVVTNWCTTAWTYSCFWSVVVDCKEDNGVSCTCQACGGMPPDLDEYMLELPLWDRARCAVYALEESGYDVTPCVEAIVDLMSMPGVSDEWTAPGVERIECLAINYGSYHTHAACSYAGTPRFATELFDDDAENRAYDDDDANVDEFDDTDDDTSISNEECLLGFGLQGLNPFESTDWVGLPICGENLAAAEVVTNWCTTAWTYSCFWSVVVDCKEDNGASCTCQACGGMPPDLDEYMLELPLWDRARCAVYALEESGYDVTPCVEAIVDLMSMPGVSDEWTAPGVERIECLAINYGSYHTHAACAYTGTPRFATELFDTTSKTALAATPAPATGGATASSSSTTTATTPAPLASAGPAPAEDGRPHTASPDVFETATPRGDATTTTPASPPSAGTTPPSGGEEGGTTGPDDTAGTNTNTNGDPSNSPTNDILIGVATTLVSAIVLGLAKKMFSNRSSSPNPR
eukprot:g13149.t1